MGLDRPIDITTDQRKTLLALLKRYLPNTTVWVYGSRVKWIARPQSDLDLVVFTKPDQERRVSELREAFAESNLPFRVDLFVWHAVPKQFRKQIEAEHVVLVEKEEQEQGEVGEWREARWGDLATLEYGKALRSYRIGTRPFRVFGSNGPIGWHNEALCSHPSVVVGRKGAYRGIHYSAEPCFVIDTAFYLKPKTELDIRWAYYALLTQDINGMDSGSAIPSTSREEFYELSVFVPPLPEQRAIAHILSTLNDKIELNRRMNETLEAMARALFKSWCIDFNPVRAKMALRQQPGITPPLRGSRQAKGTSPPARRWGEIKRQYTHQTLQKAQTPPRKPNRRRRPPLALPARQTTRWLQIPPPTTDRPVHRRLRLHAPKIAHRTRRRPTCGTTHLRQKPRSMFARAGLPNPALLEQRNLRKLLRDIGEHLCRPSSSLPP